MGEALLPYSHRWRDMRRRAKKHPPCKVLLSTASVHARAHMWKIYVREDSKTKVGLFIVAISLQIQKGLLGPG